MAKFETNKKPPQRPGRGGGHDDDNLPAPLPVFEINEPRCKVCQSPHRREIDMMLATGWSQTSVMNHWNQILGEGFFKPNNISVHNRKHLTTKDAAIRRIVESRARQIGVDIDTVEGFISTKAAVLDTLIHTGMQSLHLGHTVVEAREVLQAVQLLDKMEAEWKETAIDELMNEFRLFMESVKEAVGEDLYANIYDIFESKLDRRDIPVLQPVLPPSDLSADVVVDEAEEEDEEEDD